VNLIKNLSPEQAQAVRDIGFGGLLSMKLTNIQKTMIPNLINAFDLETSRMIISQEKSFLLTKDDVEDVFGIPSCPSAVQYLSMGPSAPESEIKNKWRCMFGNKKSISLSIFLKKLTKEKKEMTYSNRCLCCMLFLCSLHLLQIKQKR